ncbi:UDP-N-acetylglucosamine 2-epimerase [Fusobacterium polymorphum]|uniref:UDP-N-acetylglucosamine 2-epimerase n=1 Tax=Fusobacterium nucleatum subsp. polymorphum TaxID=76857 RepID=UPI00300A600C
MKKIFMTCYGGGHVEIIKELYKNLVNIPDAEITILALTTSKYKFEQEKIPYKLITDYYDEEKDKEIYRLGEDFCIRNNVDISIGKDETYLYHGYALKELLEKYDKEKIEEGFKKFGRAIFLPVEFMKSVIVSENPDLVITTNSPRYEKASLIISKELNLKTLSIEDQFGIEGIENSSKDLIDFFQDKIYERIYGDYVCVPSEITEKNLDFNKINKIFITGNPSFDKALEFFMDNNKKEKTKKESITLCYLSQKHPENILIMKNLIKFTEEKDFNLIVKIHPNEKIEDYLKEIDNKMNKNVKILNSNLYESILKSDIIITISSTAALEAAILGKPIVAKKNVGIPFANLEIGLEYENIDQIEEKINEILNNIGSINKKLKEARNKFRPKKKAGEQIKEVVEKILNNEL